MSSRFCCLLLALAAYMNAPAQTRLLTGNSIPAYIDQLPAVYSNAREAYEACHSKGKKTSCDRYTENIQEMINELAVRSNHQSRLLSMLSGKFERERQIYDFTKVKIATDKALEQLINDVNIDFFGDLDRFIRIRNQGIDELLKENKSGTGFAERALSIYRENLPVLFKKVQKQLIRLNDMMTVKGYNAVLDKKDASHPYYVQLLEARGIMLDRILKLLEQIDSSGKFAASMMTDDRK